MRATGVLAVAVVVLSGGGARAESFDFRDLFRRTEAVVQSLFASPGREVIRPPGDIDPKLAFAPSLSGTMRVIRPPARPEQRQ